MEKSKHVQTQGTRVVVPVPFISTLHSFGKFWETSNVGAAQVGVGMVAEDEEAVSQEEPEAGKDG